MLTVTDNLKLAAASGKAAKNLVIFLHGFGANGDDLIGLGRQWGGYLPDVAFVSPHAPEPCPMNPMAGFQWFDLTFRDPTEYWRGVQQAAPVLNAFIDQQIKAFNISEKNVALVGFSQGTMMALHVGLRREKQLAGIVGYSGKLAGPEHLAPQIKSRPAVLLAHGRQDDVIPVGAMHEAVSALKAVNVAVDSHIADDIGHGIDGLGLGLGLGFFAEMLAEFCIKPVNCVILIPESSLST